MPDTDYYANEQMILGCLIIYPEKYAVKMPIISADLFEDSIHRDIFMAILKTYRENNAVDTALVLNYAPKECREEITNCAAVVFSTTPFDEHLKILIKAAEERFLRGECQRGIFEKTLSPEKLRKIAVLAEQAFSVDDVENRKNIYSEYLENINKPRDVVLSYFPALDGITKGFQRGTLSIIGARPSVGKTTLALNIATRMVLHNKSVMFFTLEMTAKMIIDKLLSAECKIPYTCFNSRINDSDREKITNFLNNDNIKNNLAIIDDIYTVEGICNKISAKTPDVAVIDYVQIVRTMKKFSGDNKRGMIDYISAELKNIAKQTGCCIILLSQLKRTDGVKPPTMADLKESGGLEQDGDYIFLLYRPYVQNKASDFKPEDTTLSVEKNKFGETSIIKMNFNGRLQTFTECINGM